MFDYVNYVPNLQLLDGSCENCVRLFAALEEIMATDAPVAIVLTSDGSIVLYMEDRFLVENIPQKKNVDPDQNLPTLTGKEQKRRFKENPGKRIKIPKGNFSMIYSETSDKKTKSALKGGKSTSKSTTYHI